VGHIASEAIDGARENAKKNQKSENAPVIVSVVRSFVRSVVRSFGRSVNRSSRLIGSVVSVEGRGVEWFCAYSVRKTGGNVVLILSKIL